MKKFYITTAIDYVNSLPHIGTAYEKIGADVLARWHRFTGYEVHFQMGNDEHSVNVEKAAKSLEKTPKQYCDEMRGNFERIWKQLNISYDGFIQTSDPHHEAGVKNLLKKIMANGDIQKKPYKGWYCESCEAFLTEKDLEQGLCPNHKSKPKWIEEENYFFCLSKYRDRLLEHIEKNPDFILPDTRKNEIVRLLKEGLQDISVSRSSFNWGIEVPDDPDHVVYVWFDALINYITAVGYGWDEKMFKKWWPADMHVIGKDITRFHCVIWPAMLMSAGIPLPKTIFGHGFVYLRGEKMSKTIGNVVQPMDVIDKFGPDPLRYYLMREGPFSRDSDFTWEHFIERYNGDLANGIGNLVSRVIGMATRYGNGEISPEKKPDSETELVKSVLSLPDRVKAALDCNKGEVEFHNALASIWETIQAADRYINDHKPWEMAKTGKEEGINRVLWHVAAALRVCTLLLFPFIPDTTARIWNVMGFEEVFGKIKGNNTWNWADLSKIDLKKTIKVRTELALFPRIEEKKEEEKKMEITAGETGFIDISEFAKIDLRVAEILEAEKVEGADKLLKLQIDLGGEKRQIVAGIAKQYEAQALIGKKIVVVANLKPAKLRGIESNGMLLAASDDTAVSILTPLLDIKNGAKVK